MNRAPTPCRGFTLVELMVVVALISILSALVIPEMKGTYQDALLRSTSRDLINVFDLTYSHAVSLSQVRRVRLDEKAGTYLVERQVLQDGQQGFIPVDETGCSGTLNSKITMEFHLPDEAPAADAAPTTIPREAREEPTEGPSISFYPDGTADPGVIELSDKDGFRLSLQINPITARIKVRRLDHK